MSIDARTEAWVRLQIAGIAPRTLFEWLRAFGGPEAVLAASHSARRAAATKGDGAIASDAARVESALSFLETPGASLVAWDDADYPRTLLEIGDAPAVFYCRGRRDLLSRPALAIVGSRNATAQGRADAEAFASALAAEGLTIVSGLALGIDAAAHRGALAHPASSIAVVGTGPDRVYPAKNRALALELAERGAIISEFPPGTPPLRENFPRRNRLISGLARGVLVVEATLSSGSLITARLAAEQGRDVFALPGSIHSPLAKGCHRLIRDGAKLVETAEDILVELGMPAPTAKPARAVAGAGQRFDGDAQCVLDALGHAPVDVDTLVARSGLTAASVAAALTGLELAGAAASLPGGLWQSVTAGAN
jgi:DNA processing protein